mmetsp:Transcript_37999/g.104494  ORF Transcript_37999/g.104494 Transcript_37999/m.104494 type:complete len:301 (-) Transcript_37999:1717-2619(-)
MNVARLAMALEYGAVGDNVRLQIGFREVREKLWHVVHVAAARTSVQQRVIHHDGSAQTLRAHLLVHRQSALDVSLPRKTLQDRTINHAVERILAAVIVVQLPDEVVRSLRVPVAHDRLNHAAEGHARRANLAAPHLLPAPPDAVDVACEAVGLDEAPDSMRAVHVQPALALQLLEHRGQELWLGDADARLYDGRQQHLVHAVLGVSDQVQGPQNVGLRGVRVQALREDGAGDLVRPEARLQHLVDQLPDALPAVSCDRRVDELVVRHSVRPQALFLHLLHEAPRRFEVALRKVGLDQSVE